MSMFKGRVEKVSHEGGLLVSYSGACPALGSIMIDSNEQYVGKVDGVIGNLNESLVHVAHLERKSRPNDLVGIEITIRTKRQRNERHDSERRSNNRYDNDRRNNDRRRDSRDNQRNDNRQRRDSRDNRRSDNRQRRDSRDNRHRESGRDDRRPRRNDRQRGGTHSNNDWTCGECGNSNYSFRSECNRCGKSKGRGNTGQRKKWDNNERRFGERKETPQKRPGDWDCPQCGKSNFAKRNDCFSCGRSKRVGGPRTKGHHRKSKDPLPLHSAKYGKRRRSD
ncbi:MAG: zinc finger protein [Candidatus Poseidoniaceae archaeon]|nr:zinc finger protein [Candidatus Poseidoniaceae archaeon]